MRAIKPILKWAGGKTQLISDLVEFMPARFNKYIEPFFGGGALFFHTAPKNAVLNDISPELVNLYRTVASNPYGVIDILKEFENTEELFYAIRNEDRPEFIGSNERRAARTLYLNKTCFNGLHRVNKKGQFNTPYGRYKSPNFVNTEGILAASSVLKRAAFENLDYRELLKKHANKGDFIFLDPPYLSLPNQRNFTGYTKEDFGIANHYKLAEEVRRLVKLGCYVILTNSNSPLVHDLYENFDIEIIPTRRSISSVGAKRNGEDVIIIAYK